MSEENEKEQDYSLRESFLKVGLLPGARLLIDKEGKIIDGVHSWRVAKQLGLKIPTVVVDVRNEGDAAIFKLVTNKCRRELEPGEITQCLDVIGRTFNWKANDFVEKLPFSYSWLMKYLPDQYKDAAKAKAGAEGGKATAKAFREAAARRQPKSEDTRHEERPAEVSLEDQQPVAEEPGQLEVPLAREASEHFNNMFSSHLSDFARLLSRIRIIEERDLPMLFNYVNEKNDCNNCPIRSSCDRFVDFCREEQMLKKAEHLMKFHYRLQTLLPPCVKRKISET